MARTTEMRLVELITLRQDISPVIEYLGRKGDFQFQSRRREAPSDRQEKGGMNVDREFYENLQQIRVFLDVKDRDDEVLDCPAATDADRDEASKLLAACADLRERVSAQADAVKHISDTYKEAKAFSNLQVPYTELEHLSFLSLRIGKIEPSALPALKSAVEGIAVIVPLGDDQSRILAASSKKGRFALNTELKRFGFVNMEIPRDFKGIPADVLQRLEEQNAAAEAELSRLYEERSNFAETHADALLRLLGAFSVGMQIADIQNGLESTAQVFRLTGWIPAADCHDVMKDLDQLTEGRIAIREYQPHEVPSVLSGEEDVPVKLKHGKFISSFERMIFSYGSPIYGAIDPTPFVAVFFTVLFGIMFGDCGQGLVFLLAGILMAKKVINVGGWNKFAPIFMGIGISSSIMGLLTGEFFSTEALLEPFALWVTGLFGTPRAPILKMMPSSDPQSVKVMFMVFGVSVGIGFVINTAGLIINLVNQFSRRRWGSALFGKSGLAGALFFWYVIVFAVRIAAFGHTPALYDWIVIGVTLFFAAFGEPFERLADGKRPAAENGVGSLVITGIVELIEVVSSYMSNTVSFLRVGAFALAHAVLNYIIITMTNLCGGVAGVLVLIAGNAIVVVLEGMIVAIQVIRLQYYEFFSKFFQETGSEFKPLRFRYGNA